MRGESERPLLIASSKLAQQQTGDIRRLLLTPEESWVPGGVNSLERRKII